MFLLDVIIMIHFCLNIFLIFQDGIQEILFIMVLIGIILVCIWINFFKNKK